MNKQSFLKISFVGIGNGLNAGLGLAFLAAIAKSLDLHTFGIYALVTSLLVLFSKCVDFGTNSVFVAKAISTEDKDLKDSFLTLRLTVFSVILPISLITLAIFNLFTFPVVAIFIIGLVAYSINYTVYAFFQKLEQYQHLILINTLPALVKGLFAGLIFFKIYSPDLIGAFAVFSLSIIASSFLYFFLPKDLRGFKFNFGKVKELFKHSAPAGLSELISEGWPAANNTITKLTSTFSDVGIFSLANKISNVFAVISISIFAVLLPKNAARKREKLSYDFIETFVISIGIFIFAACTAILSQFLIKRFLGAKFEDSIRILYVLTFASAFTSIHTFMENYFFVEGKTKHLLAINLSKFGVFIVSAITLISLYGIYGLAIANLVAAIFTLALMVILIRFTHLRRS